MLDSDAGLWLLQGEDDPAPMARPATATYVWRLIVRLVMRRPAEPEPDLDAEPEAV